MMSLECLVRRSGFMEIINKRISDKKIRRGNGGRRKAKAHSRSKVIRNNKLFNQNNPITIVSLFLSQFNSIRNFKTISWPLNKF